MSEPRSQLVLYGVAAVTYITLGVFVPSMLFSWPIGAGFLLLVVWILPSLVGRLR
jgi:hypothetical protein